MTRKFSELRAQMSPDAQKRAAETAADIVADLEHICGCGDHTANSGGVCDICVMCRRDEYMAGPYTIMIQKDDDGDFIAWVEELRGCITHGDTHEDALAGILDVQEAWLEMAIKSGLDIPIPTSYDSRKHGTPHAKDKLTHDNTKEPE